MVAWATSAATTGATTALEAEGLKDAILAQAAFVSLSEASLFASAMVRVVADQAKMIKALQERLDGMLQ